MCSLGEERRDLYGVSMKGPLASCVRECQVLCELRRCESRCTQWLLNCGMCFQFTVYLPNLRVHVVPWLTPRTVKQKDSRCLFRMKNTSIVNSCKKMTESTALKRRFVTAQVSLRKAECVIDSEFELESWTAMKSLTLNSSIYSESRVIAVKVPSLSPAHSTYLMLLHRGLNKECFGSHLGNCSFNPPSTAAWDTKQACVLCQGTWWHFWASESLWISALESGFLEAVSQTGPASGTSSHARPSICRHSIRPFVRRTLFWNSTDIQESVLHTLLF